MLHDLFIRSFRGFLLLLLLMSTCDYTILSRVLTSSSGLAVSTGNLPVV